MIGGICLQTLILIIVTALTNWKKEVSSAQFLEALAYTWHSTFQNIEK